MDERFLDAICERLKPSFYIDDIYIVRERNPVNDMHFIIRGCHALISSGDHFFGGMQPSLDRFEELNTHR